MPRILQAKQYQLIFSNFFHLLFLILHGKTLYQYELHHWKSLGLETLYYTTGCSTGTDKNHALITQPRKQPIIYSLY